MDVGLEHVGNIEKATAGPCVDVGSCDALSSILNRHHVACKLHHLASMLHIQVVEAGPFGLSLAGAGQGSACDVNAGLFDAAA